jgi:HSP20 family protein
MINVTLKPKRSQEAGFSSEDPTHIVAHVVSWRLNLRQHAWQPPTDLYETDDRYVVRVEIAGMREADFTVSLDQNIIVISGVRPDMSEKRAFHQMEIRTGEFSIALELPGPVDTDQVTAIYADGFLQIDLPKKLAKKIYIDQP